MLETLDLHRPPSDCDEEQGLLYDRTHTPLCRICYESNGDLLRACACNGTQGLIHRKCLKTWVTKYSNSPTECEICKEPWRIELETPCEKFLKRWNWIFAMIIWYFTIFFGIFNFAYIAARPNEVKAALMYISFQMGLLVADRYFGKNIYKLFRFTSSIMLCGCVVLLLSEQEDYQARKELIYQYSRTREERTIALEKLRQDYELDNPWSWPMDNTTNRQLWIVVALDVILWLVYYAWKKYNNERAMPRLNHVRMFSTSSDDTDSSGEQF